MHCHRNAGRKATPAEGKNPRKKINIWHEKVLVMKCVQIPFTFYYAFKKV